MLIINIFLMLPLTTFTVAVVFSRPLPHLQSANVDPSAQGAPRLRQATFLGVRGLIEKALRVVAKVFRQLTLVAAAITGITTTIIRLFSTPPSSLYAREALSALWLVMIKPTTTTSTTAATTTATRQCYVRTQC